MNESHEVRLARLENDITWMRENLKLQAAEYERRLDALNHAREQAVEMSRTFVTREKFDEYVRTETEARDKALEVVIARFHEFAKRYESRHEELATALTLTKGAAQETAESAERSARRTQMLLGVLGIIMTVVVLVANHILS